MGRSASCVFLFGQGPTYWYVRLVSASREVGSAQIFLNQPRRPSFETPRFERLARGFLFVHAMRLTDFQSDGMLVERASRDVVATL